MKRNKIVNRKVNVYKIITSMTIGLIGLFGIGMLTYIIWNCMLYGGDNWELPISFNDGGRRYV